MTKRSQKTRLRITEADEPLAMATWASPADATRAVASENQAAAHAQLDPTDPRWVLAVKTYAALEGTTLTPERREHVMRTAQLLGLRPFDANVIMALVQDRARRGSALDDVAGTLKLIPSPARKQRGESMTLRWVAALLAAVIANVFLIWWLTAR